MPQKSADQVAPPSMPRPKAAYVRKQCVAAGRQDALPKGEAAPEVALCVTGGGLVPPAEMLGVFRGFARKSLPPPARRRGNKSALDNFDVISGASGGYIAATMYCYSKLDPSVFLDTARATRPRDITPAAMHHLDPDAEHGRGLYGWMLTFPAACCPPPGGCPWYVPTLCWAIPIAASIGTPFRLLGFGKCVGPACWPWAAGDPSWWVEFMWYFFLRPLGVGRGKFTAASQEQAADLAAAEGAAESDYVWPRPQAPMPLGIVTMASLSNIHPTRFTGPLLVWALKAWNAAVSLAAISATADPDGTGVSDPDTEWISFNTELSLESNRQDSRRMGLAVRTALKEQWAPGQPGNARGVSLVPWVFTPANASTAYTPSPPRDSGTPDCRDQRMRLPPLAGESLCGCLCGCKRCEGCQRTTLFDAVTVPAQRFVLPPRATPCGHLPGASRLSPETTIAMGGDAVGAPGVLFPACCEFSRTIDISLRVKTAPLHAETCLFTDGGVLENLAIAPTVAKGARRIASVMTNMPSDLFEPTCLTPQGPPRLRVLKIQGLAALFGCLPRIPTKQTSQHRTPSLWAELCKQCARFLPRVCALGCKDVLEASPFFVINQIFSNDVGDYDCAAAAALLPGVDPRDCRPFDHLVMQFEHRMAQGRAIAGTLKVRTATHPIPLAATHSPIPALRRGSRCSTTHSTARGRRRTL